MILYLLDIFVFPCLANSRSLWWINLKCLIWVWCNYFLA